MTIEVGQLHTQLEPKDRWRKVVQFPLVRIVVAVLFLVPPALLHNTLFDHVIGKIAEPYFSYLLDIEFVLNLALFLFFYSLYVRFIEKRRAYEISLGGSVREIGTGFLIGGGMVAIMVLLMLSFSFYHVESYGSPFIPLHALFLFGSGAFLQVLFVRAILFRNVEELVGSWAALVIIALIFGVFHLGNENASAWTTSALILSDLLLTAAFILTRRIWLVWGIHTGWNYVQDGIFGMPNSGITSLKSWIKPVIDGPAWLTGGSFGIEGSYIVIFMSVLLGLYLLKRASDRSQLVQPLWKRR